jgi:DNA-binding NtrC family response regulator
MKSVGARERGTVLIVDDEKSIFVNLKEFVGDKCQVLTAESAPEAMLLLKRNKVHVVISDYKMPGQNGLAFLIDAKRLYPGTIRVLMTAYADMDLVVRALNEGEIHRFLSKPFKILEFRAILDECLRLAQISDRKAPGGMRSRTVLIANDSVISLSALRIVLGPTYRVLSTSNGLDVLSLISGNTVDALVIGIGLEMMDGCTITAYLKKEKEMDIPIVFWSRDLSTALEDHLRDCGADFWIDEAAPDASRKLKDFLARSIP